MNIEQYISAVEAICLPVMNRHWYAEAYAESNESI